MLPIEDQSDTRGDVVPEILGKVRKVNRVRPLLETLPVIRQIGDAICQAGDPLRRCPQQRLRGQMTVHLEEGHKTLRHWRTPR